jgi:CO/xanthine dehydrogenase Mo-binding subunit
MLHGRALRSPHPHARIISIDEEACREALSLIKVEYEPLPAVLSMHEAMSEGAPLIHEDFPRNLNHHFKIERGDLAEALAKAHLIHEGEYETSRIYQGYLEPMGSVSVWDARGNLTIHAGIQTPTWSRNDYAVALDVEPEKLRIVQPLFGGGFGAKLSHQPHPLGALLARHACQPVRFCLDREEDFQCGLPRVPMHFRIKTAWDRDGKYLAKQVAILADQGAYASYGAAITLTAMYRIDIMYQCPVLHSEAHLVYTNQAPTGCYRGFGNAQKHFVHETHLDEVAELLGLPPDELRLRNASYPGYVNPHGWKVNSVELKACIEKGMRDSDFYAKRRRFADSNPNSGHLKRGIGFSPCVHVSGNRSFIKPFEGGAVLLRMNEQGKLFIYCNEPDMGQGIRTVLTMCAAEVLKLDPTRISVPNPDTDIVPFGLGCFASRGAYMATGAMRVAVDDLRAKLISLGAEVLGRPVGELTLADGAVVAAADPSARVDYVQLAWKHVCDYPGQHLLGLGYFAPTGVEYPDENKYNNISGGYAFGCHVAEVEVDARTGRVKVIEVWGVHDVGQAINPLAVEGQIQGGLAMGYGCALMEELRFDDEGRVRNPTFLDYQMPTAADIPKINADIVESFEWTTGFGAKSIGECSLIGITPALQNAIYNAIGLRFNRIPITAEEIFRALIEREEKARLAAAAS